MDLANSPKITPRTELLLKAHDEILDALNQLNARLFNVANRLNGSQEAVNLDLPGKERPGPISPPGNMSLLEDKVKEIMGRISLIKQTLAILETL